MNTSANGITQKVTAQDMVDHEKAAQEKINAQRLVDAQAAMEKLKELGIPVEMVQIALTQSIKEETMENSKPEFKETAKAAGMMLGQLIGATVREIKSKLPSPQQIGTAIGNTVVVTKKVANGGASITKVIMMESAKTTKGFFSELKKGYSESTKQK